MVESGEPSTEVAGQLCQPVLWCEGCVWKFRFCYLTALCPSSLGASVAQLESRVDHLVKYRGTDGDEQDTPLSCR